jgi:hypothetical protein
MRRHGQDYTAVPVSFTLANLKGLGRASSFSYRTLLFMQWGAKEQRKGLYQNSLKA